MSSNSAPFDCSIVIVALVGGKTLDACLRRITPWDRECHVILGKGMDTVATWRERFPRVWFTDGQDLSVPVRRQFGIEAAQSRVVGLLEDTSLPGPGWLEAVNRVFENDNIGAAAGPVLIDPALSARYQALACTEYGRFHPDRFLHLSLGALDNDGTHAVSRLPGNNLAYRRVRVLEILEGSERGLVEGEVNESLRARGLSLAFQPHMAVLYSASDSHSARLSTRAQHGRLFAGQRVVGKNFPTRLAWFVGSLLLPVVLSTRSLAGMVRAVRPAAWPTTAFWICLMDGAWAIGESVGYLAGAGRSMDVWR